MNWSRAGFLEQDGFCAPWNSCSGGLYFADAANIFRCALAFTLRPTKLRAPMLNLNTLNPQQRQAAETINGPVLILAGAGTGKTRVITFRIAHMVARGIAPANILGVTFTNKAAREMQERVRKLLPQNQNARSRNQRTQPSDHLHVSFALRPHFAPAHREARLQAQLRHLRRIGAARRGEKNLEQHFREGREDRSRRGAGAVEQIQERRRERESLCATKASARWREHIAKRYESALHACNAVDFDDLILLTLRLFREHPDALEACRAKYRYVMVDEYQDTNAAQFELVHALTQEHRNLCVVGDDDQSIYGWRGAEIANLLDLEKHFPEVKIVKLEQNYRCTTTILNAANAIIKNNVAPPRQIALVAEGHGRENPVAHLRQRRGRGARRSWRRSNSSGSRTGFRGRIARFCSARTSSRVRWKRRCARPACAII